MSKVTPNEEKWTKTRYRNLLEQIDTRQPRFIFEFGTWKGYTAVRMVKQALQYRSDVHYFGIDMFEHITVEEAKWQNHTKNLAIKRDTIAYLDQEIGVERHSVAIGASKQIFRKMRRKILKEIFFTHHVDFIFIDGGHAVETITHDWLAAESIMDENTVVIFDDYYRDITDIGAFTVIEYAIDRRLFNIEYLLPIEQFTMVDGRPQPTQMVKVTRNLQNLNHKQEQSRDPDENIQHNPYLQESSWLDEDTE